jgi:hypothetical protein
MPWPTQAPRRDEVAHMPAGNGVRKLLGTRLGDRWINPILWASPQKQPPRLRPAKPELPFCYPTR